MSDMVCHYHLVTGNVDLGGHLEWGHFEMSMFDDEFEEFKKMSPKDQGKYLRDNGDLILDSYDVEDIGPVTDIDY